jgi:putative transposase
VVAEYDVEDVAGDKVAGAIVERLDQVAREGACQMLQRVLEAEVEEFLGRVRYQRSEEFRGYRNGHGRKRTVAISTWAVPVKVPRVSDTPEASPAFESKVLPRRKRMSLETQKLFAQLLPGRPVDRRLRTGLPAAARGDGPLSPSTMVRVKAEWQAEYEAWRHRSLEHERFIYMWADSMYLGAGLEKENSCVHTLIGARSDGTKVRTLRRAHPAKLRKPAR